MGGCLERPSKPSRSKSRDRVVQRTRHTSRESPFEIDRYNRSQLDTLGVELADVPHEWRPPPRAPPIRPPRSANPALSPLTPHSSPPTARSPPPVRPPRPEDDPGLTIGGTSGYGLRYMQSNSSHAHVIGSSSPSPTSNRLDLKEQRSTPNLGQRRSSPTVLPPPIPGPPPNIPLPPIPKRNRNQRDASGKSPAKSPARGRSAAGDRLTSSGRASASGTSRARSKSAIRGGSSVSAKSRTSEGTIFEEWSTASQALSSQPLITTDGRIFSPTEPRSIISDNVPRGPHDPHPSRVPVRREIMSTNYEVTVESSGSECSEDQEDTNRGRSPESKTASTVLMRQSDPNWPLGPTSSSTLHSPGTGEDHSRKPSPSGTEINTAFWKSVNVSRP